MFKPAIKKPRRPPAAQVLTLPAPTGGLNALDALANMPQSDAVIMKNFFPTPTSVNLRKGFTRWSTGYPSAVETILPYNAGSTSKLFAIAGTSIYDATSQGTVGAPVVTGLSNARWQYVNISTPGGTFLYNVNGTDYPQLYDGTTWKMVAAVATTGQTISSITNVTTTATLTTSSPHGLVTGNWVTLTGQTPGAYSGTFQVTVTGPSTFTYTMLSNPGGNATVVGTYTVAPTISGVDPRLLISVNLYANRMFFIEKNSMRVWYLPANQIGGAALSYDFGSLMTIGGSLMAMATWTIDNSNGTQEYAVFMSTEGEVMVYAGTDPGNASAWTKTAHFFTGRPLGRRCFVNWGSDVVFITTEGFMPLSRALLTDRTQPEDAISQKIASLVSADTAAYFDNFGWDAQLYTNGNMLLVNVPEVTNSSQRQYVMNTITGAWCQWTGIYANVLERQGNKLYFGSNVIGGSAYVGWADNGYSDDGAYVQGEVKTAYNYFGTPGRQKQITMVKPVFQLGGTLNASIGIDVDFADNYPVNTPTVTAANGTLWNTAPWNTFPWASGPSITKNWQGVAAIGECAAMHMRVVNNKTATAWMAVEYVFRNGGVL